MVTYLVIFILFLSMIGMMAVGLLFKKKPISGSCGGLAGAGVDKACDCDKQCAKK